MIRISEYKKKSEDIINDMQVDDLFKNSLHEIIDFNLNRTK